MKKIRMYGAGFPEIINMDNLLGMLGGYNGSKKNTELIEETAKIIAQGIDKLSGVMSSGKVGRNRDNSKYACPSCKDSFNASDTTEHNNLLKRESGPFKKE